MAITYGFYNATNNDRQYDATKISHLFDGVLVDGVFSTIGTAMVVVPSTGLNVAVGAGRAWFNHTWTLNDAPYVLEIGIPHLTLPRIDTVILEVDASDLVRANSIKVVAGTPATVPVAPTLTNAGNVHQYPLAHISVPVGCVSITAELITNKVGTADCPFATGALTVVTTEALLAQWDAEFGIWFDEMKDHLGEDPAGELQLEIDALEAIVDKAGELVARQGNHATNWNGAGLTTYAVTKQIQQKGVFPAPDESNGIFSVTFPYQFTGIPHVTCTVLTAEAVFLTVQMTTITVSGFTGVVVQHLADTPYVQGYDGGGAYIHWEASAPDYVPSP